MHSCPLLPADVVALWTFRGLLIGTAKKCRTSHAAVVEGVQIDILHVEDSCQPAERCGAGVTGAAVEKPELRRRSAGRRYPHDRN